MEYDLRGQQAKLITQSFAILSSFIQFDNKKVFEPENAIKSILIGRYVYGNNASVRRGGEGTPVVVHFSIVPYFFYLRVRTSFCFGLLNREGARTSIRFNGVQCYRDSQRRREKIVCLLTVYQPLEKFIMSVS